MERRYSCVNIATMKEANKKSIEMKKDNTKQEFKHCKGRNGRKESKPKAPNKISNRLRKKECNADKTGRILAHKAIEEYK